MRDPYNDSYCNGSAVIRNIANLKSATDSNKGLIEPTGTYSDKFANYNQSSKNLLNNTGSYPNNLSTESNVWQQPNHILSHPWQFNLENSNCLQSSHLTNNLKNQSTSFCMQLNQPNMKHSNFIVKNTAVHPGNGTLSFNSFESPSFRFGEYECSLR